HAAGWRRGRKRTVVCLAVVVAREAERQRKPRDKERRRLWHKLRPERRERAQPRRVRARQRHSTGVAADRREQGRRPHRADVRRKVVVRARKGAERQVAEQNGKADSRGRPALPPWVSARGGRKVAGVATNGGCGR